MQCPNVNSREWKDLVSAVGKRDAYSIFINNGYDIPSDEVIDYLKLNKVSDREISWIKNNLPKEIDIEIFNILARQSSYGNEYVWGQFKNNTLNLSRLSEAGTGYHEYFHAIFRSYFPQEDIDAYYTIAANEIDKLLDKQDKSIRQYIAEKNSTFIETGLTAQDKVDLLYEEYMADQFAKYMKKKEYNNVFERIFDVLKNLINFIFKNQRPLDLLFHKIANNDYKNKGIANNRFQEGYLQDMAYIRKIYKEPIYDAEGTPHLRAFGIEESQQIVRDVAKIYYNLKNSDFYSKNKFDPDKVLQEAIDIVHDYSVATSSSLAWTLDPENTKKIEGGVTERKYVENTVKSFIKSISPYYTFNDDKEIDSSIEDLDDNGDAQGTGDEIQNENPRDDSFGKESAEKQGWSRLPQFLREYISTSSYLETDENGNPILMTNHKFSDESILPIYKQRTINVNKIYFSLTRSLIDTPNDITRLAKMYEISRSNSNQKAFVDRFFEDAHLDPSRLNDMEQLGTYISRRPDGAFTLKDITLIQAVVKGFDKYTQDPLIMSIDIAARKTTVGLANRNNASVIFYDQWQSNFEAIMFSQKGFNDNLWASVYSQRQNIVQRLAPLTFTNEAQIKANAKFVIDQLSRIGIDLSPGYVEYSITQNIAGKLGNTPDGNALKSKLRRIKLAKTDVLTGKTLGAIFDSIQKQGNPFQKVEGETEDSRSISQDASQKISAVAKGNVKFDEAAYETSYIASDGTIRYGHQDATLHLIEVNKLNNASYLAKILATGIRDDEKGSVVNGVFHKTDEEDKNLRINSMYNRPDNGIAKLLKDNQEINFTLRPADGLKEEFIGTNDEGQTKRITFVKKGESEGVHFGDMSDRDYAVYMLNLAVENYETQDILDENGMVKERIFFVPTSIGMMETSKTHHFMYLPALRNLYDKNGMTANAKELLSNEIEKEYNRIKRVAQQLKENGEFVSDDRLKEKQQEGDMPFIFSNYHTDKRRALDFSDFNAGFLSSDMRQLLKDAAVANQTFDKVAEQVVEDITTQFEVILQEHISELEALNIVKKSGDSYSTELLSTSFMKNLKEDSKKDNKEKLQVYTNMLNGFKANLAHVVLQQHLNSINALHLINGDPALMYKNDGAGTDFYKRMKTSNGAGISAAHSHNFMDRPEGFKRTNILVLKEPKGHSKFTKDKDGNPNTIDEADAQMYMNVKALKHVLLGFGKLNETTADLIVNKIERGIPLSKEDLFDSGVVIEQDRFLNPYKFIFRDQMTTLKISAFILTQNLVEVNVGTEDAPIWKPAKDRGELHDIYSLMNEKNVDFAVFETGTKTMTANVVDKDDKGKYDRASAFPLSVSTDYMRLQLENPTNKTETTFSTQLIQAIDTEQDLDAKGYIAGEEYSIGEVRDMYNDAISDKHDVNYLIARNTMYTIDDLSRDLKDSIKKGEVNARLAWFQNKAVKGLIDSGADSQLVDFFRVTDDGLEPQFDLNNPKTIEKYQNLWHSYFSKGIFSLKNKGFAAALVSSHGFTPIKKIKAIKEDGSVVWETIRKDSPEYKDIHKSDLNIQQIQYADEKTFKLLGIGDDTIDDLRARLANKETIYFKDRLQYGVPRYSGDTITGYFAEVLFPNHYPELNDGGQTIPDAIKYMFGNRIPLQDKHSMMNFEIVDFLPMEYGSSLVAPQEIVEFSGADYDIDKVYIVVPPVYFESGQPVNYYLGKNMNTKFKEYLKWMSKEVKEVKKRVKGKTTINDVLAELGLPSTLEEYEKYTLENGELNNGVNERIVFESLTTLYSNQSMIDRGIPMTPANQKKLEDMETHEYFKRDTKKYFEGKDKNPALTPLQLIRAKRANNIGKDNIGIIVNINKVFTTMNKAQGYISDEKQKIYYNGQIYDSFGNATSQDGQRIIDYLSTLTSAATDEAKDSNCAKFGLGIQEMMAAGVLLSMGMPMPDVILLVNQPIVKAYTKLLEGDNYAVKTKAEKDTRLSKAQKVAKAFELIGATQGEAKMIELNPEKLSNILFGDRTDFSEQQSATMALFLQALKINETFSAVATIMKLTNGIDYNTIDNVKRAKNTLILRHPKSAELIEGLRYALTGDKKFIGNNSYVNKLAAQNLKNLDEIERLANITFLTNAKPFQKVLKEINNVYGYADTQDKKQFEKDLLSYLTLAVTKSFYYSGDKANPNFRTSLVYDIPNTESIIDMFAELKLKIVTDPYYVDLQDNLLIGRGGQLLAKAAKQKVKNKFGKFVDKYSKVLQINEMVTRTSSKKNEMQQGDMTLAFLELFDDDRTADFAYALLDYELVKDGLQFQFQTIGGIFPVEMYKESLGFRNSAITFVRSFMNSSTKDDFAAVEEELITRGYDTKEVDLTKPVSEIRDALSTVVFGKNYTDFIGDFYHLKFAGAKAYTSKKIKYINLERDMIYKKESPIKFNSKTGILRLSVLSGISGLEGANAGKKKADNIKTIKDAYFYSDATDSLFFPRYFRGRVNIRGIETDYLFQFIPNQKLQAQIAEVEETIEALTGNDQTDAGAFAEQRDALDKKLASLKGKVAESAMYKVVEVQGSPKVAPWLNPEGEVPVATAYRSQATAMRKTGITIDPQAPVQVKVEDPIVDVVLPDYEAPFEEPERAEQSRGAIESSLDQETKDILNVGETKLLYGDIDQIIKNNEC